MGVLDGRAALVTGASSGIGHGVALALAEAGVTVAVTARRAERLDELVARIESAGSKAVAIPGDLADEGVATDVVEEAVRSLGRLDILVNAAGVIQSGGVENADTAEWRRVIAINFLATLYTCKAAIPALKAQGGGDIINVTSTAARRSGTASLGPYSTSKVAVATMTEGLRQEVGGYGIRVCNIEPGATITEVADGISDPAHRDAIRQYLNREGSLTPADVGGVVVYVISLPPHVSVPEILVRPTAELDPL